MIRIMSDWRAIFDGPEARLLAIEGPLFRRDDPVTAMHLVRTGSVALTRSLEDGSALTLARVAAGGLVAEASICADAYHCDAVAAAGTQVIRIPRRTFLRALAARPSEMLSLLAAVSTEVQRARGRIEILRLRRLSDRLDAWLDLNAHPDPGGWRRVADEIGVTPAALYRELSRRRSGPTAGPRTP